DLVAARQLLGITKTGGEVEAADTTGHPDHAGHDTDLLAKPLRHELEYGAVAHAERQHGAHESEERQPLTAEADADEQQEAGCQQIHLRQRAYAADAIRDQAAERPDHRAREHAGGSEVTGGHCRKTVLIVEINRER